MCRHCCIQAELVHFLRVCCRGAQPMLLQEGLSVMNLRGHAGTRPLQRKSRNNSLQQPCQRELVHCSYSMTQYMLKASRPAVCISPSRVRLTKLCAEKAGILPSMCNVLAAVHNQACGEKGCTSLLIAELHSRGGGVCSHEWTSDSSTSHMC